MNDHNLDEKDPDPHALAMRLFLYTTAGVIAWALAAVLAMRYL
jgi:hypothetical protein